MNKTRQYGIIYVLNIKFNDIMTRVFRLLKDWIVFLITTSSKINYMKFIYILKITDI